MVKELSEGTRLRWCASGVASVRRNRGQKHARQLGGQIVILFFLQQGGGEELTVVPAQTGGGSLGCPPRQGRALIGSSFSF